MDPNIEQPWIARVHLRLNQHTMEYANGYRGAFVTIVVMAQSLSQAVAMIDAVLSEDGKYALYGIESRVMTS